MTELALCLTHLTDVLETLRQQGDKTMKSLQQSVAQKVGRMILIIGSILSAGILILVGILLVWSYPGKVRPFLDEKGNPLKDSVSEKI